MSHAAISEPTPFVLNLPSLISQEDLQKFVQVAQQSAAVHQQIDKFTDMCFKKCVQRPGTSVSHLVTTLSFLKHDPDLNPSISSVPTRANVPRTV